MNTFAIDVNDSEFYEKLHDEPLAVLLKPGLSPDVLGQLAEAFKLIDVEHNGQTYFALELVVVRSRGDLVKAKVLDPWGNLSEADEER